MNKLFTRENFNRYRIQVPVPIFAVPVLVLIPIRQVTQHIPVCLPLKTYKPLIVQNL
jgi:hypothetical protein